jgi:hypothetical protein
MCAVFCHSEPKLATLKFLRRQKHLPPTAVNQKHPGFGRFSPSPVERLFDFFLSRSVELKSKESDGLIRKRPAYVIHYALHLIPVLLFQQKRQVLGPIKMSHGHLKAVPLRYTTS